MSREAIQSRKAQGENERLPYRFDVTAWGTSPTSPVVTLYDVNESGKTDVSSTKLSGSPSVVGNVIVTPLVINLLPRHTYRLEVQFTISGAVYEAYAFIDGEG